MSEKLDELKARIKEQIKGTGRVGAPTAKELLAYAEQLEKEAESNENMRKLLQGITD